MFPRVTQDMMGKQLKVKEKQIGERVEGAARQNQRVYFRPSPVLKA